MWGRAREERATVNQSRKMNKRNQKEGCQVQKSISNWDECVVRVFIMGSRKAHADFHWYFYTCQWVCSLFSMQEDVSGIQLYLWFATQTSHSPHTLRHPHLPTPQENFHDLELLLYLAFLVQQVRLKLCSKYGGGKAGFLLSAVMAC